jgi:hypothetical protein
MCTYPRPVSNFTDTLVVRLGLKLSQLIDVDLKNQVLSHSSSAVDSDPKLWFRFG